MKELEILNKAREMYTSCFGENGGEVITTVSSKKLKYLGVRANEDSTLTFDSLSTLGDKTITVDLVAGEVFIFPMKNLNVTGEVLGYIKAKL